MPQRFYIGPYDKNSGLQTNYEPFVIPEKAFESLDNAYVYRGRLRKRFGTRWLGNDQFSSRLRVRIGMTDGSGNFTGAVPRVLDGGNYTPNVTPAIGQAFSIGSSLFTVNAIGAASPMLRTDGIVATATYEATTGTPTSGDVVINGADAVENVYFYPSLPVMGLLSWESSQVNNEPTIAFDTRFSYQYVSGGWERLDVATSPGDADWTGSNSEFFQGVTWSGDEPSDYVLFVTNFNGSEPKHMRYLDPLSVWTEYFPTISNYNAGVTLGIRLRGARIITVFKNRMLAINTLEESTNDGATYTPAQYGARLRWTALGSPLDADAWRQDIKGKGNALDAPTRQQAIGIEFVKDRLIVYFERSTWEVVFNGNVAYPFAWQQINSELGCESSNSTIPFDEVAIGVGQNGIHACNGANVQRIDEVIPQAVFEIHNADAGIERVYGIRDYYPEMLYWALPASDASSDFPYPNRVLVFNYNTQTWAFNDDSITCFGYFQAQTGTLWSSTNVNWSDSERWGGAQQQARYRTVLGGNQEGYTFIVNIDEVEQAGVLQITDLVISGTVITATIIDHNLRSDAFPDVYIKLDGITGTGNIEDLNGQIVVASPLDPEDPNKVILITDGEVVYSGTYTGGGTAARNPQLGIKTKQYNFFAQDAVNQYVSRIDFLVTRTEFGEFTAQYYTSSNNLEQLKQAQGSGAQLGNGIVSTKAYDLYSFEKNAARLWHNMYFMSDGEYFQLYLTFTDSQMRNPVLTSQDFQLHAMVIYAEPSASRFQ